MRAVVLDYERKAPADREVPEPAVVRPDGVLFRVEEIGVCGTDRELSSFRIGYPPSGSSFLVIGHEAVGTVVAAGEGVEGFKPGDLVVPMVRRGCTPPCPSCSRRRSDLCVTGGYVERGIFGAHGYFSELASDAAADLVAVPAALREFAVLVEPLSVVEKAVATAFRYREDAPKSALVYGAGPIGILAALALQARGVDVTVSSLEDPGHPRARLAARACGRYVQGRTEKADLVVEAAGSPAAALAAMSSLNPLGVCAILGASVARGEISFLDLVAGNRVVFGSVNAAPDSFAAAVQDLARFDADVLQAMIRREPASSFARTIAAPPPDAVKIVHVLH